LSANAAANYAQGCDDPAYHDYIEQRFAQFDARSRRRLDDTLRDYHLSVSSGNNPYQVITSLSRHLKYSAQFEPVDMVSLKIDRVFEHADEMSVAQQIAGDVYDGFSSETHYVGIARAWLAYRQGELSLAFEELQNSIERADSALLGAFGPDFDFVRQLYRDGHVEPVVTYIKNTKRFWTGARPDELRAVWMNMIKAGCKIQFDSVDSIKAEALGLGDINLQELLGVDR